MADTIQIFSARAEDHDRVLDFLRTHYYNEEPLTIGCEPKGHDLADEEFNMSNIVHGTCLVAVQQDAGAREFIVGVVLAGPKESNEADHLYEEAAAHGSTKWGRILRFLSSIERDANVFKRYNVEKALHVHVMAVSAQLRGMAIGAHLFKNLIMVGRRLGFPLLTADCTSLYSARLAERLGMECVNSVAFTEYLNEDGVPVFQPPPPHERVQTFAMRL